jgi:hypothetical protein
MFNWKKMWENGFLGVISTGELVYFEKNFFFFV